MLNIDALKRSLGVIETLAARAASFSQDVAKKYEAIEGDRSRTAEWKAPRLAEIRQAGIDGFSEIWDEIRARYEELTAEKVYWASPMLVLSKYGLNGFSQGSPEEMTVRGQVLTELRMQPVVLLRMEAEGAARERNWAKLYLALLALEEKGERCPANLSSLPIPMLEQADEIFFAAEIAYRSAEIDLFSVRRQRSNNALVAIGLLKMQQERLRRDRASQLSLNWDERAKQNQDPSEAEFEASIMLTVDPKGV